MGGGGVNLAHINESIINDSRFLRLNDRDMFAHINFLATSLIKENKLTKDFAYTLFSKMWDKPLILGKKFFMASVIDYFLTKDESFFDINIHEISPYRSHANLFLKDLQQILLSCELGNRIYFDKFISKTAQRIKDTINYGEMAGKRVAILFYGVLRGDFTANIKESVAKLSHLNPDCFLFSWEDYQQWSGLSGGYSFIARLCPKVLREQQPRILDSNTAFQEYFPATYKKLSKEYRLPLDKKTINHLLSNVPTIKSYRLENQEINMSRWGERIYYCMEKCFELMQEYERLKNFQYDFVLYMRIDCYIENPISLQELQILDINEVYDEIWEGGSGNGFPAGRREALRIYTSLLQHKELIGQSFKFVDNHEALQKYAIIRGLKPRRSQMITHIHNITSPCDIVALNKFRIPNIQDDLARDFKDLESKIDLKDYQECQKFWTSFCNFYKQVSPHCKAIMPSNMSGVDQIKNGLAYKFGEAILSNSKSLKGLITMPYVLWQIFYQHYKMQKRYKRIVKENPSLTTLPLWCCPDYEEAKQLQSELPYRIGQKFIRVNQILSGYWLYRIFFYKIPKHIQKHYIKLKENK